MQSKGLFYASAMAVVAVVTAPTLVSAQSTGGFPERPVTIVVPFTPGGSPDIAARILAEGLSIRWDVPVVVENVAGAAGAIGATTVADAAPDGYTWLAAPNSVLIFNPLLGTGTYDPQADFAPASILISAPNVLAVPAGSAFMSVADIVAQARANPGTINYGTAGPGSPMDLGGKMLAEMTDTQMIPIPYKGSAGFVVDLLAERLEFAITPAATVMSHVAEGKLRILAGTSAEPYELLQDVPTMGATVPGYAMDIWTGIVLPNGVDPAIMAEVNTAIREVYAQPDVREKLLSQTLEPATTTIEEFADVISHDLGHWREFLNAAH